MELKGGDKVLSDAEMHQILKQALGYDLPYKLVKTEVRPAADGMAGFLGDHLKMTVHTLVEEKEKKIHLFIKSVPEYNEVKANFIHEGQFFEKESFALKLLDEISMPGLNRWCPSTYLKNDKLVVMPDLTIEGYITRPAQESFDIPHMLITSRALARFHAAFSIYENKRSLDLGKTYNILDEYGDLLSESTFLDSPWNRAGALLHKNFLKEFSHKFPNIEVGDIFKMYLQAFDTLKNYSDTLNVLIHKDLWANNVMFRYEDGVPINAILIDYQLIRYAPPAFDLMILLYMTTTKSFREQNEETVLKEYFTTFMETITEEVKVTLKNLHYDWTSFQEWCNKARMLAMAVAVIICPFALVDSKFAEQKFNNADTFDKYMNKDRTAPIVEYAKENDGYRTRMLELFECFIEGN